MVLFANEPPSYRQAMCRAFGDGSGMRALSLPLHGSAEDALASGVIEVVVLSGPEERARELSQAVPVVNLSYPGRERAVIYRRGAAEERTLEGFSDLAAAISAAALLPR